MAEVHSEAVAGIGHNQKPFTLAELIETAYAEQFAEIDAIAARANALRPKLADGKLGDIKCDDDDDLAKIADVAVAARKHAGVLEDLRKVEKEPFLRDSRVVDATFKEGRIARLETISAALNKRATAYNQEKLRRAAEATAAEAKRLRDEAERRRLEEEFEREAGDTTAADAHQSAAQQHDVAAAQTSTPVKAAEVTRVHTESGAVATTRTVVSARVIDWQKIDLNKLRPFIKQDAVEAALRAHVKQFKKTVPIDGVEFFDEATAMFRG